MKSLLLVASLLLASPLAFSANNDNAGEDAVNENPVTLAAHLDPSTVAAGGEAKLTVDLVVAPNHHAYKDMMKAVWTSTGPTDSGVTIDTVDVSPTHIFMDKFSKKQREGVEGKGTFTAMVHFPTTLTNGVHQAKINFTFQACSERYCLFPKTVGLDIPLTIAGVAEAKGASSNGAAISGNGSEFQKALSKGKGWAFLFVFIAGFLTSLTPCIFPMIPITISIIGARSAQNQKSKAFGLSISYVLGIATTYSCLGVLAASTGAFFGAALSNVYVVSSIALVFIAMGMSMLGLYEIQVPAGIRNRFGNANTGTGVPGAYLAGLFAGLVASPCIGPVLVSILTYVAQTAQVVFGFFLLFCFAMGMGILFIVLGTFSGLLTKMPKAGGWMDVIKVTFGVTFIAMAFFYLFPVLPRPLFYAVLAFILFFMTSYYGAWIPAPATAREQLRKGMMLAGFFAGVVLMASVIFSALGFETHGGNGAQSKGEVAESNSGPHMQWQPYADRLMASIGQNHKPVILDFYADWCVACHELDSVTYSDGSVIEQSKKFDLVKIDATTNTPEVEKLQKQYKVIGLPTVVFIDSNGKVRDDLTVTGFVKADEFISRMNKDL